MDEQLWMSLKKDSSMNIIVHGEKLEGGCHSNFVTKSKKEMELRIVNFLFIDHAEFNVCKGVP